MTILCDWEIKARCLGGMVTPFDEALINPASLDVRLGDRIMIESAVGPEMIPYDLGRHSEGNPYEMVPGQFLLAQTLEVFHMPDDLAAQFVLKSSRARSGVEHLMAGFADPGFHNSVLTLELHNSRQLQPVMLWPGMRIGQMVYYKLSSTPLKSYAVTGRYNGDLMVTCSKG